VASNRVITGAIMAGGLLASGFFAGGARAQYESVGKPLQLVPQAYSSSSATPRARVAAKKAARLETKPAVRSEPRATARNEPKGETSRAETKQHISFRRKHLPRTDVAEQRRFRRPVAVTTVETPAALAPPAAMAVPTPPPPPQPAPTLAKVPAGGELVVGGQAVQVRSPDEANELDLAANMASPPPPNAPATTPARTTATPSARAPLYDLAPTAPPAAAIEAPPTGAVVSALIDSAAAAPINTPAPAVAVAAPAGNPAMGAQADVVKASGLEPKSPVGSASWMMQVMAALGGAIAAGTAAWFLIGSASPRIKLSDWEEADGEA
jgi:hypothetical protein